MATEPTPPPGPAQRAYRAACPNCGAPVEFRSAASPIAVCSFCRSTLARDGDSLRKIGESAELFEDRSPLQLGASGKYQGAAFTLVGRLQMRYAQGSWNEWHALFASGSQQKSGWLSEDNGRYVIGFDAPLDEPGLEPEGFTPGDMRLVGGQPWSVASKTLVRVAAAQGELPYAPNLKDEYLVIDLRNTRDEVGTLDWSAAPQLHWSIGRSVQLTDLAMVGLAEAGEKTLRARGVECPSCGTALEIKLASTQSIVCHQCKAVVDVSKGVGADLAHYKQDNPRLDGGEPQIPLGTVGTLALGEKATPLPWQVVGYAERCEIPSDPEDEQTFWREYLLYNRTAGFAFIVDAEDGWSWTAPITGVPTLRGDVATYQGRTYRKLYSYTGQATWVLGEFYWMLSRGERTFNTDFAGGKFRLNREQVGTELTWSAGETLEANAVAAAFNLPESAKAALQRDALPVSAGFKLNNKALWIFIAIIVIMIIVAQCSSDDCGKLRSTYGEASNEYQQCLRSGSSGGVVRTGGGSFGGFSGGGGHK